MLVFGNSIGSGNYTRPQGEIVWCEKSTSLNNYTTTSKTTASNIAINLEAESNGVLPKGLKAIWLRAEARDSASASGTAMFKLGADVSTNEEIMLDIGTNSLVMGNDLKYQSTGWVGANAVGDIEANIIATGSLTLDATIYPIAVQLR
tara:strand:- start:684 stop:1127 length:444 start_codon:yes stop_codon:yes gene_type:complete